MTSPDSVTPGPESSGPKTPDVDPPPLQRTADAPDPMTGMPQMSNRTGTSQLSDDPDAQGLPPHVILPESNAFKRDQLRARLLVSLVALVVLAAIFWASDENRMTAGLCASGAGLAVVVLGVRYAIARYKAAQLISQAKPSKTN